MSELSAYVLITAAFLAVAWMFTGRGEDRSLGHSGDVGWKRLPGVFKFVWGFATLFEKPFGVSVAKMFPRTASKIRANATAAALPLDAPHVFASSFACALLCSVIGVAMAFALVAGVDGMNPAYALIPILVFMAIGWLWPLQNLAHYTEWRQSRLTRELPFAIDLIGAAIRSGLDFGAAMRYYVETMRQGPLVEEFSQVLSDTTLGRPFAKSLEDMAERVQIKSFSSFVSVVSYGAEIGAPISATLRMHGEDLRRERFHIAESKAARAPAVMIFPLVLFLMPAVFIVVLTPMFLRLSSVFATK